MRRYFYACSVLAIYTVFPNPAQSSTWYIKSDGTGDAATIQAGIDSCANGDTVLVAAGTFTGPGNFNIDFLGKAIVVTSESGPDLTTVDCQCSGRGFIFATGEGPASVLSGLTITNACTASQGGGIYCNGASPTIVNNVISNCTAGTGGGVHIKAGSPAVGNNTVLGCSSGITVQGASAPVLTHNIIAFNSAEGVKCMGSGANPTFGCNDIFGNGLGDGFCGVDAGNNMAADPAFCGSGAGNYFLQSDSPCAPFNSPCLQLVGALDVLCGVTTTHEETWGAIKAFYR